MSYPKDIESGLQWRVRHMTPDGSRELERYGTEVQVRSIADRMNGTVEARLISVGEWGDPAEVESVYTAEDEDDDE